MADVEHYVTTCAGCQHNKSSNQAPAGLLQLLPIPALKWGSVSMDLIIALTETAETLCTSRILERNAWAATYAHQTP